MLKRADEKPLVESPQEESKPDHSNFDEFGGDFRSAVTSNDTNKIFEMCYFPLLLEEGDVREISQADFVTHPYIHFGFTSYYEQLLAIGQHFGKLNANNNYKFSKENEVKLLIEFLADGDNQHKEKNIYKLSVTVFYVDAKVWADDAWLWYYFALRNGKYKLIGLGSAEDY